MNRTGIGGECGGVLLLLLPSGTVYVPSERWGKTRAKIHVDNVQWESWNGGRRLMRLRGRCIGEYSRSALRGGRFVVPMFRYRTGEKSRDREVITVE